MGDLVVVGLGCLGHGDLRLGAEVLHDDFLDVAVRFVQRADRKQALHALAACLSDAEQDAARERDLSSPASRVICTRSSGRLSRARWCGMPFSPSRGLMFSSMRPRLTLTGRRRGISARVKRPALVCGKSPMRSACSPPRPDSPPWSGGRSRQLLGVAGKHALGPVAQAKQSLDRALLTAPRQPFVDLVGVMVQAPARLANDGTSSNRSNRDRDW